MNEKQKLLWFRNLLSTPLSSVMNFWKGEKNKFSLVVVAQYVQ